MTKTSVIVLVVVLFLGGCRSKTKNDSNGITSEQNQEGVYIPKDLNDCFAELQKILSPEDIEKMKKGTENDLVNYHFGLGMWMRNSWGLWRGSRLSKWFNEKGISHPDDMSGIILVSFYRHLNGKKIELEKQIESFVNYWEKEKALEKEE